MANEKKWYYAKDGKPNGPFTEHDLCKHFKAGQFGESDYVFCKGDMADWVKAATVPGLTDSLELSPEPEPEHHAVPFHERAAFNHGADHTGLEKQRRKNDKNYWKKLGKKTE